MGRREIIVYVCDRCGKTIKDVKHVGTFHFMHMFKWYVPALSFPHYTMKYICQNCFESFKKWYDKEGDSE